MSAVIGYEEGDVCNRNGCTGVIDTHPSEGCSCHISPPCHSCTSPRGFCPECDWLEKDDPTAAPTPMPQHEKDYWSAWAAEQDRIRNLPLDNTKVSWRDKPHSSCSMIKEGVYPEGMTQAEVRKEVDGTFGGRFEQFGGGKFKFIAYTD